MNNLSMSHTQQNMIDRDDSDRLIYGGCTKINHHPDTPLAPLFEVGMLDDGGTPLLKIPVTSELALHISIKRNNIFECSNNQEDCLVYNSRYPKDALLRNLER